MSFFLDTLRVILRRGKEISDVRNDETSHREETSDVRNDETSYRSPSRECLVGDRDPKTIYYYEYYPNLGVSNSSGEGKSSVSSSSKVVDTGRSGSDFPTSLGRTNVVVSQNSNLRSSSPQPPIGSSRPSSSSHEPAAHSSTSSLSTKRVLPSCPNPPPSIPKAPTSSSKPLCHSSPSPTTSSSKSSIPTPVSKTIPSEASSRSSEPRSSSPKTLLQSKPTLSTVSSNSISKRAMPTTASQKISSESSSPSSKLLPHSKVTLSKMSSNSMGEGQQSNYKCVPKSDSPFCIIPKHIEELFRKDIVPEILKKPLSPTTYKDYFAALLYAEDFYIEKWSEFKLVNVTLELQEAVIHKKSGRKSYFDDNYEKEEKILVAFEIDSVPEKRPFLISRDFVFARPSGKEVLPFQGFVYQVRKNTQLLVEFGEDFLSQHYSTRKYDVSFSFNRVCLKRAHQAIADASDVLFQNFLFPHHISRKSIAVLPPPLHYVRDPDVSSIVHQILSFQAPPPYLVKGPLCEARRTESDSNQLSKTGLALREALRQIYQRSPACRILVCAPTNKTCDVLLANLMKYIPESDMFRANAAFRGIYEESSLYGEEDSCFSVPPLDELQEFRVIVTTYMSSFRLHKEGIIAGHFSHLFLVDASSVHEPELMVALANFANQKTAVVVTGSPGGSTRWVRSDIGRRHGLRKSYFERLYESNPYKSLDPRFIGVIEEE
ncbi:probable RNA helicase SDE3 isoform X2 [Tripterygium wilfordii]|uniref:probable RNA helicase SDE3 isoform X2 n=1 Tax=Tripterygium wilfordii TaxID=458696 RepID=UPI0018F82A71|nr:probable RNA helicase SDE3 isoform X2 [Tripterygium wilfordii]XP_038718999.1 probable RNA helicase SDE3 isoform X2 [Tripterygium wilfordii]